MRSCALVLALVLAGCGESVFGPAVVIGRGDPAVDSAFLDLVFGDGVDAVRRYASADTVVYELTGFHTDEDLAWAHAAMAELARATGLVVRETRWPAPDNVNFLVYWFDRADFARLMPNQPPNYVQLQWDDDHTLWSTVVFVQRDGPGAARHDHMLEQLARGLGLNGPGERMPPASVFRDGGQATTYAPEDLAALVWLYYDLEPGMDREAAQAR